MTVTVDGLGEFCFDSGRALAILGVTVDMPGRRWSRSHPFGLGTAYGSTAGRSAVRSLSTAILDSSLSDVRERIVQNRSHYSKPHSRGAVYHTRGCVCCLLPLGMGRWRRRRRRALREADASRRGHSPTPAADSRGLLLTRTRRRMPPLFRVFSVPGPPL